MAKRKVTREKMLRGQRAARSVQPAEWGLLPPPVCVCGHYEENHASAPPHTWCLHGGCPCEAYDRKEGA